MNVYELPRTVRKSKKRLGRGHGSGKVKTAGRGTKGQKAREKIHAGFEGGQLPIIKRLPMLRGKGKNRSQKAKAFVISLTTLSRFPKGTVITLDLLRKHHIIETDVHRVKVVASGKLDSALTVTLPCSKSARAAIEKAGGTVASAPTHE